MKIENNILRYYLRNTYFITGTAYAGKSTAVKLLAERYDLNFCGENYFLEVADRIADPAVQPDMCYRRSLKNWEDFVRRPPEEYARWIRCSAREAVGFELAHLISLSGQGKTVVDTNIPVSVLKEISDYDHVAVMLSPQSMSVDRFFDRSDPDKQFLLSVIDGCADRDAVMENYREGLKRINSQENYDELASSGFFTLVRREEDGDTREAVVDALARHFGFEKSEKPS